MFILLIAFPSLALAADPIPASAGRGDPAPTVTPVPSSVSWPHATTTIKNGVMHSSIALVVDCYPSKGGYILADGNRAAVTKLADVLAERTDRVVVMENPSAAEVREELKALVQTNDATEDARYATGTLVLTGAGWNGDLNDDDNPVGLVCSNWNQDAPDTKEAISLAEFSAAMPLIAKVNVGIFAASQNVPFGNQASLGPVADDWSIGFALSATGKRQFAKEDAFLTLLATSIDAMPSLTPIKANDLVLAMRHNSPSADITVATHGDLDTQLFGAQLEERTAPVVATVAHKATFPTKPVLMYSGIGLALAGVGIEAATIANLAPNIDCMSDPVPCYDTKAEYDAAYAKYDDAYNTWGSMQYVGPSVAGAGAVLFVTSLLIHHPDHPAVTLTAAPTATGGTMALTGAW